VQQNHNIHAPTTHESVKPKYKYNTQNSNKSCNHTAHLHCSDEI